jgi:tetratricopeptide (TPR) repeat protein
MKMPKSFEEAAPKLALGLVLACVIGTPCYLWWKSSLSGQSNFLPRRSPAEWIVYSVPAQGGTHSLLTLNTEFRTAFVLEAKPAQATVRIAGYRRYSLAINGLTINQPVRRGRSWKQPDLFEVSGSLRAGTNEVAVTVFNSNGPPALWLALEAGGRTLASSEGWAASCAGAVWRPAGLAINPVADQPGSAFHDDESTWAGVRLEWPILLCFAALSMAGYWFLTRRPRERADAGQPPPWWRGVLIVAVFAGAWIALFANNLGKLPEVFGFDLGAHMAYIRYILEHKSLPLATDGFEMFHPPLYYLLCAGCLKLTSLSLDQPQGVMLLRLIGLAMGIAQFVLVWLSLRLLFPDRLRPSLGLAIAAALPPVLYLSQYITNETAAAAMMSASVYVTLRLLKQERMSWRGCAGLGLCLGAALLIKFTALLLLPVIGGALLWRWLEKRPLPFWPWAARVGLMLGVCLAICGWHYARVWRHFGTPFIANWDARLGHAYWQDYGYQTSAYYLRFGEVFRHPWMAGTRSFADGVYSTLWGDGFLGGAAMTYRPPWNYDFMAAGYWLALVPTCAVALGAFLALRKLLRAPAAEWLMLLGLCFLIVLAWVCFSMALPCYSLAKAFYALGALIPFCAFGAWGFDALAKWNPKLRLVGGILLGTWIVNSFASFWIVPSSYSAVLARANGLRDQRRYAEAAQELQARLTIGPENTRAREFLADCLLQSTKPAEAAQQAARAMADRPGSASACVTLASVLAQRQQFDLAAAQLRQGIELQPGAVELYEWLAGLYLQQKRVGDVVRVSREGLGANPFCAELRYLLGTALAARGENQEAISQLELAVNLEPDWPQPRALFKEIQCQPGQTNKAAAQAPTGPANPNGP